MSRYRGPVVQVPPPPDDWERSDLVRLVDATGEAVAWIAVGAGGQCVNFQVRDGAGAWHAADPGVTKCAADDVACHLVSRDPTGCVLACAGREMRLWLEDGTLHREG